MRKTTKLLGVFLLSTLFALTASANSHGLRAGYSLSTWSNNSAKFENHVHSPYIGYVHLVRVAPILMFGTGADYLLSGYRFDSDNAIHQHSLSIPAYLRLGLGPILVLAGVHGSASFVTSVPSGVDADDFRKFDAGSFLGLGVKFLSLSVDARIYSNQIDRIKASSSESYARMFQLGMTITL